MSSPLLRFESLLDLRVPSHVAISPDGHGLAFVVTAGTHAVGRPQPKQVWVGRVDGEAPQPLPCGGSAQSLPCWSHRGDRLAFASDCGDPGRMAPWVREPTGELRRIAVLEGSVEAMLWSADDTSLLLLASDPGADRASTQGATKAGATNVAAPDPIVRRPRQGWRRLIRVDLVTGAATEVGPRGLTVWEVGWNGDGEAVAIVSPDPSESGWYDAAVALLDLRTRTHRIVHAPAWQLQSPAISPDGRHVAFIEGWASDRLRVHGSITTVEIATGETQVLAPELDVLSLRWLADGSMFYVGPSGVETMCGRVALDGTVTPIWQGAATLGRAEAAISDDGRVVVAPKEAPGEPPEVMALDTAAGGDWRPLTRLNDGLRSFTGPVAERVAWQSGDLEIEGILVTPPDRGEDRLPLVVFVHGGPTAAWSMTFSAGYLHLGAALAMHGYAVLLPNTRGSVGRGQAFARANRGCHGPVELEDIAAGVEALHDAGVVDRDRVGITGASAGGYVAAYAATRSHAFKAAVPVACISNWLSFHLTTNIGRCDELILDSDPFVPDSVHVRLSPVIHAHEASTPTLILHGALDLCTPVGQARELYQALVDVGVETELVEYEHAGHGWTQREYLLDAWERVRTWFDRHVRDEAEAPPPASS